MGPHHGWKCSMFHSCYRCIDRRNAITSLPPLQAPNTQTNPLFAGSNQDVASPQVTAVGRTRWRLDWRFLSFAFSRLVRQLQQVSVFLENRAKNPHQATAGTLAHDQTRAHTQVEAGPIKWPTSEEDFSSICIIRGSSSDTAATPKSPTSQQRPCFTSLVEM